MATKSTIHGVKSAAVVRFTTGNLDSLAVVTSTTISEPPDVATTTQSNQRKADVLAIEFKLLSNHDIFSLEQFQ